MAQKSSWRSRAVKGGILAVLAAGIWLGTKLGGFGLGGSGLGLGPGTGTTKGGEGADQQVVDKTPPDLSGTSASVTAYSTPVTPKEPEKPRLRVVIDGDRLVIADFDEGVSGETASAADIAKRVESMAGDDQGVRIRIERTKRATAGARSELLQALDQAGVKSEQIQESTEFLK
jgi:hypothetical protein